MLRSIDKILIAHRNAKMFVVMLSGPFLVFLFALKYMIKGLVLYYIYKHSKKGAVNDKHT